MKFLMVCLGNICRSPLAQGVLESKIGSEHQVDSAGTSNYHVGQKPDKRSIEVAAQNGIDISHQKSRHFKKSDFEDFDIIYVMDKSNFEDVCQLTTDQGHRAKVKLLLSELSDPSLEEVPDPYYGGKKGFEEVYALVDKATDAIAKELIP